MRYYKLPTTLLIILFICAINKSLCQRDTIYYKNRDKFIFDITAYFYDNAYVNMPLTLSKQIKKTFRKSGLFEKLPRENRNFRLALEIDSCGNILNSLFLTGPIEYGIDSSVTNMLEREINEILMNSSWKVYNVLQMSDTIVYLNSLIIPIDVVKLRRNVRIRFNKAFKLKNVLAFRNQDNSYYFSGFKNFGLIDCL